MAPADLPPIPAPSSSRPSTSQCRDRYYDDSNSDSEPENEREEFISSRLGMAHDSVEWDGRPTSASTAATPQPDPDEEERLERDREDREALQDLAWELASTVECEGRLTRNEGDLEGEGGCYGDDSMGEELDREGAATPMTEGAEVGGVGIKEGGEVMEMAEVMSNFELYQRDLMEADSD